MSWFSSPENQFGAMGSSSRRFSFAGNGYAYQPIGGVESLEDVRIPIWSTKCVTATWFGPGASLVDADLQPVGTDRLAGTVTNRLDIPLEDAVLAFGKQVYLLENIAPGATSRVGLSSGHDRSLSGYLLEKKSRYLDPSYGNGNFRIDRSALMLTVMFHDSESSVAGGGMLSNDPLHDEDLTGQLCPAATDAGGPRQASRRPARPGQRALARQGRRDDDGSDHPSAEPGEAGRLTDPLRRKTRRLPEIGRRAHDRQPLNLIDDSSIDRGNEAHSHDRNA